MREWSEARWINENRWDMEDVQKVAPLLTGEKSESIQWTSFYNFSVDSLPSNLNLSALLWSVKNELVQFFTCNSKGQWERLREKERRERANSKKLWETKRSRWPSLVFTSSAKPLDIFLSWQMMLPSSFSKGIAYSGITPLSPYF